MKHFFQLICAFVFVSLLINHYSASGAGHENPGKSSSATKQFLSGNHEGLIGVTEESPVDNPVDNIFHVNMTERLCGNEKVWLTYELDGVEDHTSVSRSINDQVSVGGYLVKRRKGWAAQREQISGDWLKEGDNVIRFTMPEQAQHSYSIRNLKIEVENPVETTTAGSHIIFNQPSAHYFFDKAYIKGLVTGADDRRVRIMIDGKEARMFNGEFESVINFESAEQSCVVEVEAIYPDGSTTCHSIRFSEPQTIDFAYSLESYTYKKEKFFQGKETGTLTLNGAALTAAEGSLKNAATLSITTLRPVDLAPLDAGMENVTKFHAGFRFLPHGTVFNKEVNLRIPYDAEKIPDGYTESDIRTYFFDEQSHHWVPLKLDTVLVESTEVLSNTLHFTDYINAIIKVPESPEAQAYNSTSMKGIKAANPTAAVNLIDPPQGNSTGRAALSYPINIPGGRAGMQPQLAINYNSGSGNGWLGMGWNLAVPSIGIETRWGVPRYDGDDETETYSFNGEMLTPVAHRSTSEKRSGTKKQFYPRVEGAFNQIIRHGTSTENYWWEVTDKNGTRYFYGGSPAGPDAATVLTDNEANKPNKRHNIAHWALSEIRDPNGNSVRYYYAKVEDAGVVGGSVKGYQIYLDRITYTGFNGSDGKFSVHFTRDRQLEEVRRTDVTIAANLGFKQVTADLLRKIEVKYDGDPDDKNIRSYVLNYKKGAFFKTLLMNLQEFDARDSLFTTHTFEYYDDVKSASGYVPFAKSAGWQVGEDGSIRGDFKKRIDGKFDDNASMISGTKSSDNSLGMAVTVGFNPRVFDKTFSVGGSFNSSSSESESLLTMIDLNGDGLPDKVFIKNGKLHYRPNLSGPSGQSGFGNAVEIKRNTGQSVTRFFREKSKTKGGGLEAHGPAAAPVFGGYSRSKTRSEQSIYFTEVNGDQLPDLVDNGKVYFTRINQETKHPEFVESSGLTPSPISQGGTVKDALGQTDDAELQQAIRENPLHDVVKMWEAPYNGQVRVTAPVRLVEFHGEDRAQTPADGVRVAIQLNGVEKWVKNIGAEDYSEHTPAGVSNLTVSKGDRLYFRVGSIFNGDYDQVEWAPVVEYLTLPFNYKKDVNDQLYVLYDSRNDFKLSAIQKVSTPENGTIQIHSQFTKPLTTDDIQFELIRETTNPDDAEHPDAVIAIDTLWLRKVAYDTAINLDTLFEFPVTKGHYFHFKVHANTNVNWSKVNWKNRMYYTALSDPQFSKQELFDSLGNPIIEFHPVTQYTMFNNELKISQPNRIWGNQDTVSIEVTPQILINSAFPFFFSGEMYFSVKKKNTLLYKDTLKVVNNTIVTDMETITLDVLKNDSIFVEYHVPHIPPAGADPKSTIEMADFIAVSKATIKANDTTRNVEAGLHKQVDQKLIFGAMYHHWGQFAYMANETRATSAIIQEELKVNESLKDTPRRNPNDFEDGNDLQDGNAYKPYEEKFIILVPMARQQLAMGFDNDTYVSATGITSSRMGDNDPKASASTAMPGTGAKAISKMTESTSNAYSLGVSAGVVGASGTMSNGTSKVISDFVDFNGDRYPDVVVGNRVQFTTPQGGLSDEVYSPGDNYNMLSTNDAKGFSLSGSFTTSKGEGGHSWNIKKAAVVSIADGKSSAGISANKGEGHNSTDFTWLDINGDGLPDKVSKNGVRLNLGYSFEDPENWNHGVVQNGESTNEGAGLGISLWNGSISGGISLARSDNEVHSSLQDMNSDGLVDLLLYTKGQPLQVRFNQGSSFAAPVTWSGAFHIGESSSTSQSANVAFTAGIYIPAPINIKITVNPSYSEGKGASRELSKLNDMNGDGFPDYIQSNKYDHLNVAVSTIGRTNLLKGVKRPLGASFAMTYSRVGNTYLMPNSIWALDSVFVFDGFHGDGADTMLTTYAYENGFNDRHERDFYGFEKVVSRTHDTKKNSEVYTVTTQTFRNDNYYEKGLLLNETMTDAEGNKYIEKENIYKLKSIVNGTDLPESIKKDPTANVFPALVESRQKFYEGQSTAGKSTRMTYTYNERGNVTSYTDFGDESEEDDLTATMEYHDIPGKYIVASPKSIEVLSGGIVFRKREATIDQNTGNVLRIKQFLNETEASTYDMEYDAYGNLKKITRPSNIKGQRLSLEYEYEGETFSHPTKVKSSYGYISESTYDVRFGVVVNTKDINGNETKYEIDALGRVLSITGPYEKGGANKTIEFEYHSKDKIPWALTSHYDPVYPKNKLQTSIFVDGLGRVLQTKKDASIFTGEGKPDIEKMVATGRIIFDAFGRTTQGYYPVVEDIGTPGKFNPTSDDIKPAETEYDVLGRAISVTLPDGAVTQTSYGFGTDRNGRQQFVTKTTDANGKQTEQFTDVKGRVTTVKNYTSNEAVLTSFGYNAISEQIESIDDLGRITYSVYDNFGRKIERKHPDGGVTRFAYDLAGNLIELVTANLDKDGHAIRYSYDFERLREVTYPQNPENNVKYTYGEFGAPDNRAGRIVLQEDASGAQEFFYGPLGETIKNIRTIVVPQFGEQTYQMEWTYDTWNRLTSMTYPDGEKVDYTYNIGGLLLRMDGKKKNASYGYIKQLGYDKFQQRVFLTYGNGTKTTYDYNAERRRLSNMVVQTSGKRVIMNNNYSYDKVNHILSLVNTAPIPASNLMGGSSEYTYSYDDLYQLTSATGTYKGANEEHTYSLSMNYNSVGAITHKTQIHLKKGQEQKKTSFNLAYVYGETQPNAPLNIGQYSYTYDANGNQSGWDDNLSGQRRNLMWDEENRLRAVKDNGAYYHYVYDASGQRVLKGQSTGQRIFVNGEWKAGSGNVGNYTVYVNPYVVLKSGGYTKHYYIEGQRVVSKLGGGWDNNGNGPLKAGEGKVDYVTKGQRLLDGIVKNLKFLGADGQILTAGKSGKVPPGQVKGSGNVTESFRYFYHPDHLGSTSYVTDASGEVFQHVEYFAFGQTFVEEHSNTDRTPFLFNGKELDEETGLYYYGARYYEPGTSVWLSLDPLADEYPGWSPYNYCLNNPIVNVDPDGRSTHTDSDGNVVAVYNDDDLGIYKHSDLSGWIKTDVLGKTGDGVTLMGHTLMWNSFTTHDPENSAAGKINFGSYEAQRWVYEFEDQMEDMIAVNDWDKRMTYAANAGNGDKYDYKTIGLKEGATDAERRSHIYRGSQISEGIYVSGRDVGNFAAGAVARITNQGKMDFMLTAGGFQLSGNSKMGIAFRTSHWKEEARKAGWPAYGEGAGSNFFQRLGFENVKSMEGMKQNEVKIWGQKLK